MELSQASDHDWFINCFSCTAIAYVYMYMIVFLISNIDLHLL